MAIKHDDQKIKILKIWEKAYNLCPYILGVGSTAKLSLAAMMYYDNNYSNNQVGLMFAMGIASSLLTYDIYKKVKEPKENTISGLEEKIRGK